VRNPFRSEPEAFRFLLLTIGYFALIVIGALIDKWVGLAVFIVLSLVAGYFAFIRGRDEPRPRVAPTVPHPEDELRILVVANETLDGSKVGELVKQKGQGRNANVLVVAPALPSPLQYVTSDEDPARRAAQERVDRLVARLREAGIHANGDVGDSDPVGAIEDALRIFGPDEIIIATHPEGRSHWLEQGVVATARQRFAVPITHVVVDVTIEREEVL
jgi:GABA permease